MMKLSVETERPKAKPRLPKVVNVRLWLSNHEWDGRVYLNACTDDGHEISLLAVTVDGRIQLFDDVTRCAQGAVFGFQLDGRYPKTEKQ